MFGNVIFLFQWDEDVEIGEIFREFGDIEWLHHNILTQNNIDGLIVSNLDICL